MKCSEYYNARKHFKDGDLTLCNGGSLSDKCVRYLDSSYYSHIGVAKWIKDRLFTIEVWNNGIQIIPLSRRMKSYNNFCIARIKDKTHEEFLEQIYSLIDKMERDNKRNYFLLPRVALLKRTNIDLIGARNKITCSELAKSFTDSLNIKCYKELELITPQDFIKSKDDNEVEIFYDYHIISYLLDPPYLVPKQLILHLQYNFVMIKLL